MKKYKILKCNTDFIFIEHSIINTIGSREKRIAFDLRTKEIAYFKYEKYKCSESCSEKLSYELAKVLDYKCAHIELAEDEYGKVGILNYIFLKEKEVHNDASFYIDKNFDCRNEFYTIFNIKKCLDEININLFFDFLKIMVFDALIGETDRHEGNWGITITFDGSYKLSPLYDNGCNLLRYFKDEEYARKYYESKEEFIKYIKRAKSLIYKQNSNHKYKLIELIDFLYQIFPNEIEKEINNLEKLTDVIIEEIVNKIPDGLLTKIHKDYIIIFLKERKKMLKDIIN